MIRLDNGPEFFADRVASWCADRGIALRYIQPGQPNQNAFGERFNRTFNHEVLVAYVLKSLDQVCEIRQSEYRNITKSGPITRWTEPTPSAFRARQTV